MNRTLKIVLVLAVLAVALGSLYFIRQSNSSVKTVQTSTPDIAKPSTTTHPVATDKVTITNFSFSPADITVAKGTVVTWTNNDSTSHTITESDNKTGPNSGSVTPGSSYSFTFTAAGTYPYHCSLHPDMIGTVVVTD